jgi:hypothetical protein
MTRIQILEDQKAIFVAQKEVLENKRGDIYVREQQAISDALLPFFYEFSEEVEIEVTRGSVYFKMAHPECSYKKELFNLYLREDYDFENSKKSFKGVDLSYYTTQTKGESKWELKRLQLLGKLAEIVDEFQQKMVYVVNEAVVPFKVEYGQVYEEMASVGKAIRELEVQILGLRKDQIAIDLKNGGVEFDKAFGVQMKFNYIPRIVSLKLIDISKSGKKATAIFEWEKGRESREENVSVDSIINQVMGLSKNIVQQTLAE